MIVNAANIQKLLTGFRTTYNQAFEGAPSTYERVATRVPSTTASETYGWLGQLPKLREWIGDRQIQNLEAHDYAIKNRDFELTIGVDRNAIEDDTYGVFTPLVSEMGRAAKTHPDELVFALLVLGFTTACYDGQYFFDTDHPGAGGASVSNYQAGALAPWFLLDVTRAIKPLIWQERKPYHFQAMNEASDEQVFMQKKYRFGVDGRGNAGFGLWQLAHGSKAALTADNYALIRAAMAGRTGEGGKPLGITGNLLVVGPSNEKAAREILVAERNAAGATNIWQNSAELLVSPYLT
jgi:phage major head subunit gpT-like protein